MCTPESNALAFVAIWFASGLFAAAWWNRTKWARLIVPVSMLLLSAILLATGCEPRFSPIELVNFALVGGLWMNLVIWINGVGGNAPK
jgi:hypothetical protein